MDITKQGGKEVTLAARTVKLGQPQEWENLKQKRKEKRNDQFQEKRILEQNPQLPQKPTTPVNNKAKAKAVSATSEKEEKQQQQRPTTESNKVGQIIRAMKTGAVPKEETPTVQAVRKTMRKDQEDNQESLKVRNIPIVSPFPNTEKDNSQKTLEEMYK